MNDDSVVTIFEIPRAPGSTLSLVLLSSLVVLAIVSGLMTGNWLMRVLGLAGLPLMVLLLVATRRGNKLLLTSSGIVSYSLSKPLRGRKIMYGSIKEVRAEAVGSDVAPCGVRLLIEFSDGGRWMWPGWAESDPGTRQTIDSAAAAIARRANPGRSLGHG